MAPWLWCLLAWGWAALAPAGWSDTPLNSQSHQLEVEQIHP
jgi:hypothetical protein